MQNKENRICDFIDFVVAPIEFDKQRKNLATIRIYTQNNNNNWEKNECPCARIWAQTYCSWNHQQLQLNIVIEDIERQFQLHGLHKNGRHSVKGTESQYKNYKNNNNEMLCAYARAYAGVFKHKRTLLNCEWNKMFFN